MNEYRSKEARKDRYGREKRLQEGNTIRKVYSKVAIWIG